MYPCPVRDTLLAFAFQCWSLTELSTCSLNSPELIKASLWGGAGFVLSSNICRKVRSVPSLPLIKEQDFVAASWWVWLLAPGRRRERKACASLTVPFLVLLLSIDPDPIILFAAGSQAEFKNLFHPGLQALTSLAAEGRNVFFLSCCTVVTKVWMEAEQPPEYPAEMFIELKWKRSYQKINSWHCQHV